MVSSKIALLFSLATLASAFPAVEKRTVTSLNQNAFKEAQQRDATASRKFSSVEIVSADGRCLFVNELSGDFRANQTPIQVGKCDGSAGQKWDIITKGKHNNLANAMLVVNSLTQACMNFEPRRAAGTRVTMFSCGGRADGSGTVTDAQLFTFFGFSGPDSFEPENATGTCFTIKGSVLDEAACVDGSKSQQFSFGQPAKSTKGSGKSTTHAKSTKGAGKATATHAKSTKGSSKSTATHAKSTKAAAKSTKAAGKSTKAAGKSTKAAGSSTKAATKTTAVAVTQAAVTAPAQVCPAQQTFTVTVTATDSPSAAAPTPKST